ncbi:MAG: hypothetical protein U9Q90_10865 [Campylobacterota bacterium]|nr:hypothetical protein [Campylobacterota bacterium]
MRIKIYGIILGLLVLLQGCAQTQAYKEKSALIVWKSPAFRYADMGFISDDGKNLKVEIYGSGSALMRLKIDGNSICMSQFQCMSKERFNRELLSTYYPTEILENIFRGKPVFSSRNIIKKRNGFTQDILNKNEFSIHYEVLNNRIIFRDTINKIFIKVQKQ